MEYQRVAALGLKNLASSFDLRSLAAKVGALEAVVKMLRSRNIETARYAAKAASELSLHEENGRKMVLGGALKPLLEMAKSGDATCENEAVNALANLALSEVRMNTRGGGWGGRGIGYCTVEYSVVHLIQSRLHLTP